MNTILKYISRNARNHNVRFAFHALPQLIKELCNVHLFGPFFQWSLKKFSASLKKSWWPGHGKITLFRVYYNILAFLLSLRATTALHIIISCCPIIQKVRHYKFILLWLLIWALIQGLFHQSSTYFSSFPLQYFSLSLNVPYLA